MFAQLFRSTFALAIAASATLVVIAGSAAPVAAAETVVVNVDAWNLQNPAGRNAAEAAVTNAARRVCDSGTPEQPAAARASRDCMRAVMASARPQIDAIAATQGSRTKIAGISLSRPTSGTGR
jgi:UrcA family protein